MGQPIPAERRHSDPSALGLYLLVGLVPLVLLQRGSWVIPKVAWGQTPATALMVVCALLWLCAWLSDARGVLRGRTSVRVAALLIPVVVLLSFTASAFTRGGVTRAQTGTPELFWAVIDALFVLFIIDSIRRGHDVAILVRVIVWVGALAAALLIAQSVAGVDVAATLKIPGLLEKGELIEGRSLLRYGLARPQGTASHPLEAGVIQAILAPLALAHALRRGREVRRRWAWLAYVPFGLILVASVQSISRMALVGAIVGSLLVMLTAPTAQAFKAFVALLGGIAIALLLRPGLGPSLLQSFTEASTDPSLESRELGRFLAFRLIDQHPWLGLGPGSYDINDLQVLDNQYLGVLAQTGVLGLGALLFWFASALAAGLRAIRVPPLGSDHQLIAGLLGSLTVVMGISFGLDTGAFPQVRITTMLIVGMLAALGRDRYMEAARSGQPRPEIRRIVPSLSTAPD